jgi:hypothetical protein
MRFNVVKLDVPKGAVGTVTAVNYFGHSCGYVISSSGEGGISGFSQIWRPDGTVLSAGTNLEKQQRAWAWDINFNSQVVGSLQDDPDRGEFDPADGTEAFYFALTPYPAGTLINLTDLFLGSGQFSTAGGLNDPGYVVGTMSYGAGIQAFTYGSGPMPLLPGTTFSKGMRINSNGLCLGICDASRIFTYDQGTGRVTEIHSPLPLGFDAYSLSYIDINDKGQISATIVSSPQAATLSPVLYDPSGSASIIQAPPNHPKYKIGYAFGLNNSGDVVGSWLENDQSVWGVAFVKFASSATADDLNNLIPSGTGWVLQNAVDISDETPGNVAGPYIVGTGQLNGEDSSFILILVSELPQYDCGQLIAEIRGGARELTGLFERVPQTAVIKAQEAALLQRLLKLCSDFQLYCDVPPPPGPRPK